MLLNDIHNNKILMIFILNNLNILFLIITCECININDKYKQEKKS